ncbi:MAG: DUF3820 family protein [Desulfopila sp.]|jgi:uncharacterized protein (DUF3820 family)|nr:DUF3820 family protein [Desulfopila sp.]
MAENKVAAPAAKDQIGSLGDTRYHALLLELARYRMPFGRYAGLRLIDLPEPYVVWFSQKGYPEGKLGEMLQIVYEIKVNGLEYLFKPLRADI